MEVHINNNNPINCVDIFISRRVGRERYISYFQENNIIKETLVDESGITEPSLKLDRETFQALVDSIHSKYKPSEGKFTEGKLEATEKHLEDMRKLVFKVE